MRRETGGRGKPPTEVLRAVVERLNVRQHAAWYEEWKDTTPDAKPDLDSKSLHEIDRASVSRRGTTWTYADLEEFLSEYAAGDCLRARVECSADFGAWSVHWTWDIQSWDLNIEAPTKGDLLYIASPLDDWDRERRAAEDAELAEAEAAIAANSQAVDSPKPSHWWDDIGWAAVRDNMVTTIVLTLLTLVALGLLIIFNVD